MANDIIDISDPNNLMDELKKALSTNCTGAKAGYIAADKGKKPSEDGNAPDISDVALWNEFGTERIPSRPFLRNAQNQAIERGNKIVQAKMEENVDVEQICKELGVMLQEEIKKQITRGTFTPNAPSTVKQKGSSRPLVDTGNMLQSVHWAISTTHGDKIME